MIHFLATISVYLGWFAFGHFIGSWRAEVSARRELDLLMRRLKMETDDLPPDGREITGTGVNAKSPAGRIPLRPKPLEPTRLIHHPLPWDGV